MASAQQIRIIHRVADENKLALTHTEEKTWRTVCHFSNKKYFAVWHHDIDSLPTNKSIRSPGLEKHYDSHCPWSDDADFEIAVREAILCFDKSV